MFIEKIMEKSVVFFVLGKNLKMIPGKDPKHIYNRSVMFEVSCQKCCVGAVRLEVSY